MAHIGMLLMLWEPLASLACLQSLHLFLCPVFIVGTHPELQCSVRPQIGSMRTGFDDSAGVGHVRIKEGRAIPGLTRGFLTELFKRIQRV